MTMRTIRVIFTLIMMTFIVVLVVLSFGYDRKTALLPIIVGLSSLMLGGLSLASEFSSRVNSLFMTGLFQLGGGKKDAPEISGSRFGLTSFWLLLLLFFIFLFGFLISLPVWIFGYILFQGRRPWSHAIIASVSFWFFLYGFFVRIMSLDLFPGILFGGSI